MIELVAAGLTQDGTARRNRRARSPPRSWTTAQRNGEPYFFIGLPACVVGDDETLVLPGYSEVHDWELELAVVIGREAFRVSREDAMSHVAGYTIVNDITTRDYVFRKDMKEIGTDWYRAKNAPGFLPTGPFLVPAPFVDGGDLNVRLELNGQVMQDASTSDLLFDIPALISAASQTMPLLPGDLLLTGSPAGNGQHWKRFLQRRGRHDRLHPGTGHAGRPLRRGAGVVTMPDGEPRRPRPQRPGGARSPRARRRSATGAAGARTTCSAPSTSSTARSAWRPLRS